MNVENDADLVQNRILADQKSLAQVTWNSFDPLPLSDQIGGNPAGNRPESPGFDANSKGKSTSGDPRTKSSLRIRYEAEVKIIRRKLGDLEQIRATLGLTQRKMSQLLFVDPSAWTRWTKPGEEAPPHIYRMLQWYLALEDKYPALDTTFWLSAVAKIRAPVEDQRELEILRGNYEELRREVRVLREKAESSRIEVPRTTLKNQMWIVVAGTVLLSFLIGFACAVLLRR